MSTLIQKFLALFSTAQTEYSESQASFPLSGGMPLASAAYMREFAQRLGLEVDDLSPGEQTELKVRLDKSMDFREANYGFLYHEVYQLGHGYSLADASRVSAQINKIAAEPTSRAYLDYRENAVAAEALMSAGSLLEKEGDAIAAARLFKLADARRHRSSVLELNAADVVATDWAQDQAASAGKESPVVSDDAAEKDDAAVEDEKAGLAGLMHTADGAKKNTK